MNDMAIARMPRALAAIQADTTKLGFSMASERKTGALLAALAASKPGGKLLELGTGTGIGTAWLLAGMDADARLITVDNGAERSAIAKRHLSHDPRVTFYTDDAANVLPTLPHHHFDLIFADT